MDSVEVAEAMEVVEAMEIEVVEAVEVVAVKSQKKKKNRIQVSSTKKPMFFYLNLAKRHIKEHNEVVLSALGMAITTVVTISEILKRNGIAREKCISTSTVDTKDESNGRIVQKAKIEIFLAKTEKQDDLKVSATGEEEADDDSFKER